MRKKYKIFDSDTVTSIDSIIYKRLNGNKNSYYTDLSLPQPSTSSQIITNSYLSANDTIGRVRKPHRRTASDSSKDKKSGAYLHVKGKRKAPDPPPPLTVQDNIRDSPTVNRLSTSTNSGTLSPYSTLGRKKRKAPPPPPPLLSNIQPLERTINEDVPTVLSNGLMDDEEIKAIIEGTSSGFYSKATDSVAMDKSKKSNNVALDSESASAVRCTDTLKLEKGILRSTRDITNGDMKPDDRHSSISPSSISPRPWYKRSPASNKDYAIPFKKEIVLRTMEKRKIKKTGKGLESPQLPEFGFSRNSSLFEGFFSRSRSEHDRSDDQEKRRSGIGMPNISELDREAADIVQKEQESLRAKRLEEHEKYYNKIGESTPDNSTPADNNGIKFTMNNAFIQKNDRQCGGVVDFNGNESRGSNFINRMEKPSSSATTTTESSIFSNSVNKLSTKTVNDSNEKSSTTVLKQSECNVLSVVKKNESTVSGKHMWICAYCTLENANWRVICEVCERIRHPDKQTAGMPVIDSATKVLQSSNLLHKNKDKTMDQKQDWENKTDKVMKYFRPRISYNSLSKSASETSVGKSTPKKTVSKVPLSPKMLSRQKRIGNRIADQNTDIVRPPAMTKSSDRLTSPLIDSSAVVTTVTPVFYAPSAKAVNENDDDDASKKQINRNIDEVRLARLAKFSQDMKPQEKVEHLDDARASITDSSSLEREKQRLREMIRAMNARALAEKYPVIQKSGSLDGDGSIQRSTTRDSSSITTNVTEEHGLKPGTGVIKKVMNRKHYVEDKEISDNSNFASNSKLDKEKLFLKLSPEQPTNSNKLQRPDVLVIPTPIQELNEDEMSSSSLGLAKQSRIYSEPVNSDNSNCAPDDKPDLVKISEELSSTKGLENFKATLRNSSKQFNYTNTLALNKILKNLEVAIAEGKHEFAASLAMDLAKMKVTVTVTKQQQNQQRPSEPVVVEPPKPQNVV